MGHHYRVAPGCISVHPFGFSRHCPCQTCLDEFSAEHVQLCLRVSACALHCTADLGEALPPERCPRLESKPFISYRQFCPTPSFWVAFYCRRRCPRAVAIAMAIK